MSGERRKHPRIRTKLPCDLHLFKRSHKGVVRDISEGGLSVLIDIDPPEQGESVAITIHPPGRTAIEVSCVFWHGRRVRVVGSGTSTAHLGLVLSSPCDEFFALVASLRGKRGRSKDATEPIPKPAPDNGASAPLERDRPTPTPIARAKTTTAASPPPPANGTPAATEPPSIHQYSVRVKQDGGPRSCRIVVGAMDLREAEARALAEAGDGWIALEVKRVEAS